MSKLNQTIGIDLGTTNSAAAVVINGRPIIIPSSEGPIITGKAFPSIVAFKDNKILVGEIARRQMSTNPEGTISGAKRKMGTNFKFTDKQYTPEQISAFILSKIKKDAESFLGETMDKAVITVPAYFNDNQRRATKDAAEIAGLQVVRILNEPTAALLAYRLEKIYHEEDLKIMVFDIGGGTLDVTIIENLGGGIFIVNSTSGDIQLGGIDMDNALLEFILQEFKQQFGIDVRNDKLAVLRIEEAAEEAKIRLSFTDTTEINLPFIAYDPATGPKNLLLNLTRAKLEEIIDPIVERCRQPIMEALQRAKLKPTDVGKIILVGGPTRMPIIRQSVTKIMGKEPDTAIDPMEAVAIGAAIQGAIIAKNIDTSYQIIESISSTLGVEVSGGLMKPIIKRDGKLALPIRRKIIFTTATDNQTSVTIHMGQGEKPKAADCVSLGLFKLSGIPLAPRRVPRIEVTLDVDLNGIINIKATEPVISKETKITISKNTRLSEDQVEKLRRELPEILSVSS